MVSKIWFKIPKKKNGYKWLSWFEKNFPRVMVLIGYDGLRKEESNGYVLLSDEHFFGADDVETGTEPGAGISGCDVALDDAAVDGVDINNR